MAIGEGRSVTVIVGVVIVGRRRRMITHQQPDSISESKNGATGRHDGLLVYRAIALDGAVGPFERVPAATVDQDARRTTYCASDAQHRLGVGIRQAIEGVDGLLDVLLGALPGVIEGAGALEIGPQPPPLLGLGVGEQAADGRRGCGLDDSRADG